MGEVRDFEERDRLTNLLSRRPFERSARILQKMANEVGGHVGWIVIDVDDVNAINGYVTHAIVDKVLLGVSARPANAAGVDDVVARIGGDEFGLLFPNIGAIDELEEIAAKILRAFDSPVKVSKDSVPLKSGSGYSTPYPGVEGHAVAVKVSIGLTVSNPGDDVKATFIKAEEAMEAFKWQGKARATTYCPEIIEVINVPIFEEFILTIEADVPRSSKSGRHQIRRGGLAVGGTKLAREVRG